MKSITLIVAVVIGLINSEVLTQVEFNQPLVVNEEGMTGDPSAMLDVQSTSKGLLIPRMDSTQRNSIASPAEGLLVYDSSTLNFWYFQDGSWTSLSAFEKVNGVVRNTGDLASDDFVFGSPQLDYVHSFGNRMFFDKEKSAFRAGITSFSNSLNWDQDSLGTGSVAFGNGNLAKGTWSTSWGNSNESSGNHSTSWGASNTSSGTWSTSWGCGNMSSNSHSTCWGWINKSSGSGSTSWGSSNIASGINSTAWGFLNSAQSFMETLFGQYADTLDHANPSLWEDDDYLLVVGNGVSENTRSNALTLLKNGNLGLGNVYPEKTLHVKGDIKTEGTITVNEVNQQLVLTTDASAGYVRVDVGGTGHSQDHIILGDPDNALNNIGIGTDSPTALLEVNADIVKKVNGGSWTASSDRRLKQDIIDYREGLTEITQIRPVKFRYNVLSGHDTTQTHIGVIAQELQEVAPHMVSTFKRQDAGYLQVDNSAMILHAD